MTANNGYSTHFFAWPTLSPRAKRERTQGSVHTELLTIALAMPKKGKQNIINGTVHTGLSKILSDSYAYGKRQIFTKDFAKECIGYTISLVSMAIAKESLFGDAIAKRSVNGP